MPKTKRQLKAELNEEIEFIKSWIRSLDDIKHGRVYPMKLHHSKV